MKNFLEICLLIFSLSATSLSADTIYIIGEDGNNKASYWTIIPPNPASSFNELDIGTNTGDSARSLAFSSNQTVYIAGNVANVDEVAASYWMVDTSGVASPLNTLTATSDSFQVSVNGIAFTPTGIGYMVGINEFGNPTYWTISPLGVVSGPTEFAIGGFASAVGFTSSGIGYIVGTDSSNNVCYWNISTAGVVSGPFGLIGGEAGGAASAYAVSASPSGTTYIVGNTTATVACYWTISPLGVASSAIEIDGGSNSLARGVAFLPNGNGIIVGQTSGNVSSYWNISSSGSVGTFNALPNGSGNGSSAYGVAFSSSETAYIVGGDNANQAVYWTLPFSSNVADYHILDTAGVGIAFAIAIYFPQNPPLPVPPLPPQNLSGKYVRNDFGWIYEYCAVLKWFPSSSSNVVAYNIYKNGIKISTVNATTTEFQHHDQKRSNALYAVTAVDDTGNESSADTIVITK